MAKININVVYIVIIIALFTFLPYLVHNYSFAVLLFSGIVYMISMQYFRKILIVKKKFIIYIFIFIFYTILLIMLHQSLLTTKAYFSFISIIFVFGSAYIGAFMLKNMYNKTLYNALKSTFIIFLVLGIIHIVFVGGAHNVFPFREASHYALFIGPFSIALFVATNKKIAKTIIVLWLLIAGILLPNTTILVYIVLIGILYFKWNIKNISVSFLLLFLMMNLVINNKYFSQRIFFWGGDSSSNLSALVYLQGIEDAYNSLISTSGFGLGFQQLGTQEESEASLIIKKIIKSDKGLNRQDGGFTAAKIIAELGYLGMMFLLLYILMFKKAYKYLSKNIVNERIKRINKHRIKPDIKFVISYAFIYSYSVELFIRGAGYFSLGSYLFYWAVAYLYVIKK